MDDHTIMCSDFAAVIIFTSRGDIAFMNQVQSSLDVKGFARSEQRRHSAVVDAPFCQILNNMID
eukprot:scaffold73406_cov26-Attheya_sp.AAC.2